METTLTDVFQRSQRLFGRQLAAVDGDTRLTYEQVGARCRRLAGGLIETGVREGDRVAVLMANGHRYLECYYAIPGMGAVITPLNNRCTVLEHRYALQDAGVDTLIVDEAMASVASDLKGSVRQIIDGTHAYEQLLAQASESELRTDLREGDLAGIFYTGGTTGAAKGVQLTHRNLVANALHTIISVGYTGDDRYLHVAPMFHLGDGCSTYALTWLGGGHVFLPQFDPAMVNRIVGSESVTCMMIVPAMALSLLNDPSCATADYSSLRLVLHGAAPMSTTLLQQAVETMNCAFFGGYGMTEAAPFVTVLDHEERLLDDERLRSVGRAVVGVEVGVRRDDGSECKPCEVGEVVARGPNFTPGYWHKPEETAQSIRDGWFWTGDIGYLSDDGYLFLVDRVKDMIISGGENVYSIEVEEAISSHPAVLEVAVIGIPDDRWGERVHSVVALRSGTELDIADLRAHCKNLIADYKRPRSMEVLPALPRSGPGKVLKRELRSKYWSGMDRQIH